MTLMWLTARDISDYEDELLITTVPAIQEKDPVN